MKDVTLGILGAGRAGTAMARLSLKAGYQVLVSNSRGPESLALMIDVLMPGVSAATSAETAERSDVVILALPLGRYRSIPAGPLVGKIVIDAMNHWAIGPGRMPEVEDAPDGTSERVQIFLGGNSSRAFCEDSCT